uniref:Uncharacterized protein n=1 Tax=Rhizophora mucronata TaxID=61149 RepID=A0A2P2QSW7_RHIMU
MIALSAFVPFFPPFFLGGRRLRVDESLVSWFGILFVAVLKEIRLYVYINHMEFIENWTKLGLTS